VLSGCGGKASARQPRIPVTVASVERRSVPLELVATGTVEAVQSASVGSQVGGTVVALAIREGQDVQAGQPLIRLDPRPFAAALDQARGALARDRAQWQSANLEAERAKTLLDQNLLSQSDWEQKRAAADALRASVISDSAAVEGAALALEYATIRAPVSGRAGAFSVHVGDLVKAATTDPLITVVQLHPIRVRFTLPEADLALMQRHRDHDPRVLVRPSPDDSTQIEGRLVFVDNAVDPNTGTLLLKGEFDNRDGKLWPGEFVEARLVLATEHDRVVVPAAAVTVGQQGAYVYVMNPDSTASPRPVAIMRTQGEVAIVAKGLEPGETVVTDGQFRLSPGARVQVRRGQKSGRS
jgi:multidrug efflux system membrane fusion protein